jgi:N-acylneuraminate cytidylyltransferase/CMP-N,N'-diacetyllegionaminic acid synthase
VPLVAHSIRHAQGSGLFDAVIVSTDDQEVRRIAENERVDLVVERPKDLATATAGKVAAILHAVKAAEGELGQSFDIVVDLDVTSPLRVPEDIVAAVALLEADQEVANVITGSPARRSPYFNLVEREDGGAVRLVRPPDRPLLRRQDAPECFDMNASIYVWRRRALSPDLPIVNPSTRLHVMPEERSHDVDSELDWTIVAHLYTLRDGRGTTDQGEG